MTPAQSYLLTYCMGDQLSLCPITVQHQVTPMTLLMVTQWIAKKSHGSGNNTKLFLGTMEQRVSHEFHYATGHNVETAKVGDVIQIYDDCLRIQ